MTRWLVTQENAQFAVDGLEELRRLVALGEIDAADMVQPPGKADWVYAGEVPELSRFFPGADTMDDEYDDDERPRSSTFALLGTALVAGILIVGVLVSVLSGMFFAYTAATGDDPLIGEGGLAYSQMLVTEPKAPLYADPDANSRMLVRLDKDSAVELLAKRGDFYRARTDAGQVGWVSTKHVVPMYLLGGGAVMAEYDPLYNPDRYVEVTNATWFQVDQKNTKLTVFRFMISNESMYPMTDLVLMATIKDSKGNELERVEFAVEGVIPAHDSTTVGTFGADKRDPTAKARSMTLYSFEEMALTDPDLALEYTDGIEVEMKTEDFTEARIDLLEIRAIPNSGT